jgi:Uma2 family endonuclease
MKPILNDPSGRVPLAPIPPLEPGDRLTRDEFERRYEAMPHVKKAELIEGIVYMPSPVRVYRHGKPHFDLITCFGVYCAATPGIAGADNTSARLDMDNEPQPNAMLFLEPACGGQVKIGDDDYVEGAPELVAEVASSSVSFDLNTKFNVYRRCGVKEYVVWRVMERAIDWFVLTGGTFERMPAADGLYKSRIFPGLWLDSAGLIGGDLARALAALRTGIDSPEHAKFVESLRSRR